MSTSGAFKGQTVIVTGAGSGLGRSHALAFASHGANVVVNDLNAYSALKVVEEIADAGGQAVAVVASVTEGPKIVQGALDAFGGLHVLVNNAGILKNFVSITDVWDEHWDLLLDVHVTGTISCTEAAWPVFEKQKYGRIVNTTSAAGLYGYFPSCGYSAAKAAIISYTRSVAAKGAPLGIKANAIVPVAVTHILEGQEVTEEGLALLNPAYVSGLVLALTQPDGAPDVSGRLFEAGGGWMAEIRTKKGIEGNDVVSAWKSCATVQDPGSVESVRYDGRTIIVTGPTGQDYAKAYAGLGANIVVHDIDEARAQALVQEIVTAGGKAMAISSDNATVVQEAQKAFGSVHVLVATNIILSEDPWEANLPHLRKLFQIIKASWPIFKSQNYGRVLFELSPAALDGSADNVYLATAHGAIVGLMRSIAVDGKTENVLVNAVFDSAPAGESGKVHNAVAFITSECNESISGAIAEFDATGTSVRPVHWERPAGHSFGRGKIATPEDVVAKWKALTNFDGADVTHPAVIDDTMTKVLPEEVVKAMAEAAVAAPHAQWKGHFDRS